ncbi:MAG: hypothetical protein HYY14_01980 [Candidatus Omnitrophica bacterium]|nr:hypothetical protein [Candidatus Omnitrophota bacterium]
MPGMGPNARFALLGVLFIIFLATTGGGYLFLIERNELTSQNQALTRDLGQLTEAKQALELDREKLSSDLNQKAAEYTTLYQEFSSVVQDRDVLGLQLEALSRKNELLTQKLEDVERELAKAREAMARSLEKAEAGEAVHLPPIVVHAGAPSEQPGAVPAAVGASASAAAEPKSARIITVNNKHRFVVINAGKREGIFEGMQFSILDDRKGVIGRAEAAEVRDKVSALSILQLARKKKVREGFTVVQEL